MARLPAITNRDQVAPEHQATVDNIVESRGSVHGPFTMLLHCPPLAGHMVPLGGYIRFEGKLDKRVRVLVAMTVAREFDCLYVWGAQTAVARKREVPESTIAAIHDRHSRGVPAEDVQIIEVTRALIHKHRIDAATMQALQQRFGNEQVIELTGTVGYYTMLTMTANACELEPSAGADVLKV